jgi:hypothetical protein
LDIKPYVPAFDCLEAQRVGWLQNKSSRVVRADDRFAPRPTPDGRIREP